MKGELVKTITTDGLEHAGFWVDNHSEVAVFHSHGTSGDFYTHKFIEVEAEALTNVRVSFLSANNRGHDVVSDMRKHSGDNVTWSQGGGAFERFEDCVIDIAAWIDFLSALGIKKIILQAHSLTQKILYYQSLTKDPRVVGQIHLSPCNDAGFMLHLLGKETYQATNKMIHEMVAAGRTTELLPKELAVVCPMGALAYQGYLTEEGVGNLFPYHDPASAKWHVLQNTTDPLLAIFGGADNFIKPSVDIAAALFKTHATAAKSINIEIIPNAPHSYVGYEVPLVEKIQGWIENIKSEAARR